MTAVGERAPTGGSLAMSVRTRGFVDVLRITDLFLTMADLKIGHYSAL